MIDADFISNDYKQDYGLYVGVPLYQSKGMKDLSDKLKLDPATSMSKAPGFNARAVSENMYGFRILPT